MLDNDACVEWIASCYKSTPLKQMSFNKHYHYQILSIPFSFSNRDFIFRSFLENKLNIQDNDIDTLKAIHDLNVAIEETRNEYEHNNDFLSLAKRVAA